MRARHLQAVTFGERDEGLVISFCWTEAVGELLGGQVVMVVWAERVIDFSQQVRERVPIPQRQADRQVQPPGAGEPSQRMRSRRRGRKISPQHLSISRPGSG